MKQVDNPFRRGDSGKRIAGIIVERLTGGLHHAPGGGLQPENAVRTAV
jgi:hypothetical protein